MVPGGIELSNMFTCVRSVSVYGKLALILFYPFSHYYFIKSVSFPAKSFAHWDDLLQRGKIWSLVASNAHGGFHVGKFLTVNVPSYADVFSFAGLGIDKKYAAHPEQAIRNGDFLIASAAPASRSYSISPPAIAEQFTPAVVTRPRSRICS